MTEIHLGGVDNNWEYVLFGDVFKELEVVVENCKTGQVYKF